MEVAWGEPERQVVLPVRLPSGATAAEAIEASGIAREVPGLVVHPERVGVFGRKVALDHELRDGDRVEIYRPLLADPKEIRRARARGEGS